MDGHTGIDRPKRVLLAIDTATEYASVALYEEGRLWAERNWYAARNHTTELMPAIADMCAGQRIAPADLRGVAVAVGPGSFTGMRVGVSAAKGICLALQIPIVGIATLDVLARPFAGSRQPVRALVHAGRGRFCMATYRRTRDGWGRQSDFQLVTPAGLAAGVTSPTIYCGELDDEALDAVQDALGDLAVIATPAQSVRRAAVMAEMAWDRVAAGEGDDLATLNPIYLHQVQTKQQDGGVE